MSYQKPEEYVKEFIDDILRRLGGKIIRKEVTIEGSRLYVDYQYGKILIEAKAPGKRSKGRDQLLKYMKNFGYKFGLLIDIPTERYYIEYPNPYNGKIGFELYLENSCIYERSFAKDEISIAGEELYFLLKMINELKIASIDPKPEIVLMKVRDLVNKWESKLMSIVTNAPSRVQVYISIWKKNMELLYGKDILRKVEKNLVRLFVELTIYTTILKILGSTIVESILGGGRYTIPLKLLQEGYKAAIELFWERKALTRFNINYIFERDEYDWIFSPEVAKDIDEFFRDVGKELVEIDWSKPTSLDLLKRIYQNIVDVNLRRQLGEFYTPDWLAKLIIWRALHLLIHGTPPSEVLSNKIEEELVELIDLFYKKHGRIPRFIDPTCGTFTFGVQYINALLRWYIVKRPKINPLDFANEILKNVVGIDLNPVAVITAKVNYLLQIYRLLTIYGNESNIYLYEEPMIPIYRIDLLTIYEIDKQRKTSSKSLLYYLGYHNDEFTLYIPLSSLGISSSTVNKLKTTGLVTCDKELGECYIRLSLPISLIKKFEENISKLHRALIGLSVSGVEGFKVEIGDMLTTREEEMLNNLTKVINELEKYGINKVWYSIFINHVLAIITTSKKFDIVVGNLPWVNVSRYPENYRNKLREVAKKLNVNPPKEAAKKLDISVILYAISAKYLLANGGVIGLMMPTSVFRGLHGNGWRSFFMDEKIKIYEVFDLEDVRPFEKAENQPGIVFAKREVCERTNIHLY